jgi:hypothetical protein
MHTIDPPSPISGNDVRSILDTWQLTASQLAALLNVPTHVIHTWESYYASSIAGAAVGVLLVLRDLIPQVAVLTDVEKLDLREYLNAGVPALLSSFLLHIISTLVSERAV